MLLRQDDDEELDNDVEAFFIQPEQQLHIMHELMIEQHGAYEEIDSEEEDVARGSSDEESRSENGSSSGEH